MVRIDPRFEFDQDEAVVLPRKRRRYRRRLSLVKRLKRGCCLVVIILFGFGLLIGTAALAKSGIIDLPLFSELFYRLSKPDHAVEIDSSELKGLAQGIQATITNSAVNFEISEKQLTFFMRQVLTTGEKPQFAPTLQAAISPESIEFFGLLLRPLKTNLTIELLPEVIDGNFSVKIKNVKVGTLELPQSLVELLINNLVSVSFEDLNQKINQFGRLETVELVEGKIIFSGKPK